MPAVIEAIIGVVFCGCCLVLLPLTSGRVSRLPRLLAVVAVVGGAVALFEAISSIKKDRLWWLALALALLNIGVGVYLLRNPLVAAAVFVVILAICNLG